MNTLENLFERKNIILSLRSNDVHDLVNGWEVKSIVENKDVFENFYSKFPLESLNSLDNYYLYLLSTKFIKMRNILFALLQEEHKTFILNLSNEAEKAISIFSIGDVIKYINENIQDIFDKDKASHDVRFATLDFIAKYSNGISKESYAFLCAEYGYLLIDRFDQFENIFEKNPDLFETIYPTGHLEEINSFRLDNTLEVWRHLLNKEKSSLKDIVSSRLIILAKDIKKLSETASVDNIMQVEGTIRKFHLFLQRIKSPLANEFAEYAQKAEELLSKNVSERGQVFQYKIPVEEIISKWKKTENWEIRLLVLTHDLKPDENNLAFVSRLSNEPEGNHYLFDSVSTNIPTDEYFTISHQQKLSIMASIGMGTMTGILRNQDTLIDYQKLVVSAISLIIEQLSIDEKQLQQDVGMFFSLVQLVANNLDLNNDTMHGICYGLSMYTCALSEKLLRILYIHLAKEERYIPVDKATLGELLSVNNTYIVGVFGENHIKNLSFFLQKTFPSNVGQNIRNSLAHWVNVSTDSMTYVFVTKMLWIFTDILNTLFWYCLKDVIKRNDSN